MEQQTKRITVASEARELWTMDERRGTCRGPTARNYALGTPHPSSIILSSIGFCLLAAVVCRASSADSAVIAKPRRAGEPTRYMIIITGGELLSGAYPDGHTYFLTKTLHPLGLHCIGSMCVDDKPADMKAALRYATDKAPLVIVTGGLGPTANDITRETLSDFTGIALKERPDVLQAMAQRFRVSPSELLANLRKQTQVPTSGTYLKNSNGTAVGLVFESAERRPLREDDAVIVALPGPPRELQPMVREELVPYLSRRFGTRSPGCSLRLRFVGLGQSQIDQMIKEHVALAPEIMVSSQFEGGRVDFTFSEADNTPQERARLEELKQQIMKYLGEYIYADDNTSLEEHVVGLLEARGVTLALAEIGSGGSLAATLSSADGSSRVLAGAYVAPTAEKLRNLLRIRLDLWTYPGAPGPERKVEQLAIAAAQATQSQCAVAVGDSRNDENGNGYVDVSFKLPDGRLESQAFRLSGDGELARSRLSTQLLDQLRRRLK
ncbi:MAG: molybdopterin-binding protein [Planctomycetota bacterium]